VAAADISVSPTAAPPTAIDVPVATSRRSVPWPLAGAAFLAGIFLVWLGTDGLSSAAVQPRIVCVFAGLLLAFVGLDRLLKRFISPALDTGLWLSIVWVGLVVLAAVFADLLPLKEARDASNSFDAPVAARPDLFSAHPLGTDKFGLDLLGGVIYGARLSLQISLGATAIGIVVGGLIGVCAGYFRGKLDALVGVLTNSLLAFPPLILLIALMVAVKPSVRNLVLALAILGIPTYIRLARANTMAIAQREFVLAARSLGAKERRIVLRELVPNVALPLLSYAFIIVAVLIVAEGSLSFLGLSIPRPEPTWGNMIYAGNEDLRKIPHLVFVPATVMFLTVFALNRISDRARKIWDPRDAKV
jgi:peptide/nickel transport system permease protein